MKPVYVFPFYAKFALILISLIALGYVAIIGKEIICPLIFSFLFAILLLPLANFLERKCRLPRSVASIVSVLLLVTGIVLVFYLLVSQLSLLAHDWPLLKAQIAKSADGLQTWIENTFHVKEDKQLSIFHNITNKLLDTSTTIIGATVLSVSSIVLFLVFILIYTFFLLFHRSLLLRFLIAVFTDQYAHVVYEITVQIQYIIKKYIIGLFLQMCIVAAIAFLIFLILGIKYAFLLGLVTGIFNLIPYVGIFTAFLISAMITFATSTINHTLFVAIAIICIHLMDSNFIMPKIVGSKVKINPLIVVLGVIAGEMIWGIPGMFLSIPVLAVLKVVFDRIEGLQPWGLLLGDEEHEPSRIKWLKKRSKKAPEESL